MVGQSSPFVSSIWGADDTMTLPLAFVTDTNLCLFPKSGRNLPPCDSWFGVWVLSGGRTKQCPGPVFASWPSSDQPRCLAFASTPKAASGHSVTISQGNGAGWLLHSDSPSYALAFRTPVSPLGLYSPPPQGRRVHNSREPQIILLVNTLNRCLQMTFLLTHCYATGQCTLGRCDDRNMGGQLSVQP